MECSMKYSSIHSNDIEAEGQIGSFWVSATRFFVIVCPVAGPDAEDSETCTRIGVRFFDNGKFVLR